MRPWVYVALVTMLLPACIPPSGGQQSLREGMLRPDIGQKAFRTEWGEPDAIIPILSTKVLAERWKTDVDTLVGRGVLSLWVYHRYGGGTEVLFDDDGDLIAWRTDLTVLAAFRSSPSETSAFVSRSRVTDDAPNCVLVTPSAVSFPSTSTCVSRISCHGISTDHAPSNASLRRAITVWPST